MTNPFRKQGTGLHRHGDWLAPEAGLVGAFAAAYGDAEPGGYAVVGALGSGKSAALDAIGAVCASRSGFVLALDYGALDLGRGLAQVVLERLVQKVAHDVMDAVWTDAGLDRGEPIEMMDDERFDLVARLAAARRPLLITLDEAQRTEGLPIAEARAASDNLARLSEAVQRGGGALAVSLTPAAWAQLGPRGQSRFASVDMASGPSADEIVAVLVHGLPEAPDGPQHWDDALIDHLVGQVHSMRDLHHHLHLAWKRAVSHGDDTLRKPGHR